MEIVLYQPQIPSNTGNIVRTCHALGAKLVLVKPLGFSTTSRMLKRAGLDYWLGVEVEEIDHLETYIEGKSAYFFSSKVSRKYTEVSYSSDDLLIFGSETTGLPPHLFEMHADRFVTIPMRQESRCLNLSNSVAIGAYELLRQTTHIPHHL